MINLFWSLTHGFKYLANQWECVIDKKTRFLQGVRENDLDQVMVYINSYKSSMESALEIAALNNNKKLVLVLLKKSQASCSGILMEELLIRGNYEMAELFIRKDRWWGTSFDKYQNHFQKKIEYDHDQF